MYNRALQVSSKREIIPRFEAQICVMKTRSLVNKYVFVWYFQVSFPHYYQQRMSNDLYNEHTLRRNYIFFGITKTFDWNFQILFITNLKHSMLNA